METRNDSKRSEKFWHRIFSKSNARYIIVCITYVHDILKFQDRNYGVGSHTLEKLNSEWKMRLEKLLSNTGDQVMFFFNTSTCINALFYEKQYTVKPYQGSTIKYVRNEGWRGVSDESVHSTHFVFLFQTFLSYKRGANGKATILITP